MLEPSLLAQAIATCHGRAVGYHTLAYRASHLKYFGNFPTANALYAAPSVDGTRYVLPGGPAALYASFDADTPYREVNQDFFAALNGPGGAALAAAGGLRPDPLVTAGVHIILSRLLDLFDLTTRTALGIASDAELLAPWKNAPAPTGTQRLGQAVYDEKFFEGILYPSAQISGRKNLVLFPERLLKKSRAHFQGFPPLPDAVMP